MKSKLWIFIALAITISSCQKEDYFTEPDFDTEFGDQLTDDDYTDHNDSHNHDHGTNGQLTTYQIQGDELSKIKDFDVNNNLLPFQQDYQKHLDMWNFTTRLIPIDYRGRLAEFEVFHGGGELLGYVEPINTNDLSRWRFALAIDAAEKLDEIDFQDLFTYVTVHEFGHVVTLNESQINAGANFCTGFETQEGCTLPQSYINALYELGWADIYNEFQSTGQNDPFAFYEKYRDRFVSDYAATNPGEDIAEVFTFFITESEKRTGNTIADQKVNLMYEFEELVEMRDQMRQSVPVLALRPGSWATNPLRKQFRIGKEQKVKSATK